MHLIYQHKKTKAYRNKSKMTIEGNGWGGENPGNFLYHPGLNFFKHQVFDIHIKIEFYGRESW